MSPLMKFHSVVLGVTTLIIFYLWELLSNIMIKMPEFKIPLAALVSIGIYRLVLSLLKELFLKFRPLKKWVFGASYLEGVWVGFYMGTLDKERFFIETFEQDFETLIIRGKAYDENQKFFGSWISENANLNLKKGILSYTYESNAMKNTFSNSGFANFVMDRKTKDSAPYRLVGFSSNVHSPKKLRAWEEKVSDKPDEGKIEDHLKKAKDTFERDGKHFIESATSENYDDQESVNSPTPPKVRNSG